MSSRNQKNFLQLSIATIFLFQFFIFFSPSTASGLLNNLRLDTSPNAVIRYELKITAVNDNPLPDPIIFSQDWRDLGIQEYGAAQLLIDKLARALDSNDIEAAQQIYSELSAHHIDDLDLFNFEIQRIMVTKAPVKSNAYNTNSHVTDLWSSEVLETK